MQTTKLPCNGKCQHNSYMGLPCLERYSVAYVYAMNVNGQEVTKVESPITNHSLMGEHLEEHSRSSVVKWVAI